MDTEDSVPYVPEMGDSSAKGPAITARSLRACLDGAIDLAAKTFYIAKKEVKVYLVSPIGYMATAAFLFLTAWMFTAVFLYYKRADTVFMNNFGIVLVFIVPVVTMRLLAEERKLKTMELLMTSPVTPTQIVLGKYLACMVLVGTMIALTFAYVGIQHKYGTKIDWGPYQTGYVGLFLMTGACVAIGMFTSSLTENQLVAAVASFAILLMMWILHWMTFFMDPSWVTSAADAVSIVLPYQEMVKGVLETRYIVYYLSLIGVFLFVSVRMLESSRWR
jgi:ABC-2 type transport system permease protein